MKIEKIEKNNILIVGIKGRLDGSHPAKIRNRLHGWLKLNHNMILDCGKLEYLDSSGLGALLSCLRKAVALGGDLKIVSLVPAAAMVFELTGTHNVFSIFKTIPQALASFHSSKNNDEDISLKKLNPQE